MRPRDAIRAIKAKCVKIGRKPLLPRRRIGLKPANRGIVIRVKRIAALPGKTRVLIIALRVTLRGGSGSFVSRLFLSVTCEKIPESDGSLLLGCASKLAVQFGALRIYCVRRFFQCVKAT